MREGGGGGGGGGGGEGGVGGGDYSGLESTYCTAAWWQYGKCIPRFWDLAVT